MPDPFLQQFEEFDLDADMRDAEHTARFFGASLRRERNFVFLECKNQQGRTLVARIDCTGYPQKPPPFVFVNPSTHMPSANRADWPLHPARLYCRPIRLASPGCGHPKAPGVVPGKQDRSFLLECSL